LKIDSSTSNYLQTFFDKIFVITLHRASERQTQVEEQLQGLPFEFFYGADKQQLNQDQLIKENIYSDDKAKALNRYHKGMVLGHIACSLSHRNLYEHIVANGYKRVLIFEDDVVTLTENLHHLQETIKEVPADWELLYFGYAKYEKATFKLKCRQSFYKLLSYLRLIKWSPLMVSNLLPKPFSKHLQRAGFHDLTHAYAVTDKACVKLIDQQTPVVFNSDSLLTYLVMNGKLNAFSTRPQFFTQQMFIDPAQRSFIHHL
jgi:glycosyl transferase, family 25